MNGTDIKKAAINKAKQVAQAANSNGGKKRRKGQDLKPIITTEQQAAQQQNASPGSTAAFQYKYVFSILRQRARPAPTRLLYITARTPSRLIACLLACFLMPCLTAPTLTLSTLC